MEQFIKYSLIVHVTAGCVSLLAGLGAIIFRNKIKQHRPFGSVYFWSMTVVFVTSLYVSLYKENWFLFFISILLIIHALRPCVRLNLKNCTSTKKPNGTIGQLIS